MRPLLLLFLLASGAAAQEADCDGDARLLERAPTLHAMLGDPAWVEVIISSPVEEYQRSVRDGAEFMAEYVCLFESVGESGADGLYALAFGRSGLIELLAEPVGIWSAALDWESFAGTRGPAMRRAFAREVEALGFRPVYAEGGIASLSFGPLAFPESVQIPGDLALFLEVQEAVGRTSPTDLLVGDLRAEADILGRAETFLAAYPSSLSAPYVQQAHIRALLLLASLHPVQGEDSWQVGAANASGLPIGGERSALTYVTETYPDSRYADTFARILADPPLAIGSGDLDVIVVGRSEADRGAEAQALMWLDSGIDIVGVVPLGSGEWGVAFRYYPADDPRLDAAEARARDLGLTPERVRIDAGPLNRIDWR